MGHDARGEKAMKVMLSSRPTEINDVWTPYVPDDKAPWSLRRVVHLHHRAGFAGTWEELQRDLKNGPTISVDRLLAGQASARVEPDFVATADLLTQASVSAGNINRLRAAWFYRMLFGPDPLGERLTLLWHDHFATANGKVQDSGLMRRQNDTFRRHCRGNFADLLNASLREPALLIYLDSPANRKAHPNENLARELMELFTLGAGRFTEADVKEAARCLTGWDVSNGEFTERPEKHDDGTKTVLGQTGPWTAIDLISLLLKQPAAAERVAYKLCREFFGENVLSPVALKALAVRLRDYKLDIRWAVETILKSTLFFSDANLSSRVRSPVEFIIASVRALDLLDPPPSTLALADWSSHMGQTIFDPPNVGGWPGGRAWIDTRGLIARTNFAATFLDGPALGRSIAYDPTVLAAKHGFGSDPEGVLAFHHKLFFGIEAPEDLKQRSAGLNARKIVARMLAMPEAQLG